MSDAPSPTIAASPGAYRWVLLAGVSLIYFCFGLTIASLAPLVRPITQELGIGHGSMGAIMGAWPLVYIAAAIPCGLLLDRLGTRISLVLAALIMAGSGLARAMAGDGTAMFFAVAAFGLGGPLISIGAPKLIAQRFEGPARGTAMGIYITGMSLGSISALSLTNSVMMPLTSGDWRTVVLLYAGFVALCGGLWLAIASHPAARIRLGDGDGGKKFNLAAFGAILSVRQVRLVLAMSVGIFFFNHGLNNWLPEILRAKGMDAASAGLWASIPTFVGIAGALIIPRLAVPERRLKVMTLLFLSALSATLLLHLAPGPGLAAGLILQGTARGAMMTVAILLLMETPGVPKERLGLAGGLFFSAAEIGGVMGPLTIGFLSETTGGFTVPLAAASAVVLGLLGMIALIRRDARTAG